MCLLSLLSSIDSGKRERYLIRMEVYTPGPILIFHLQVTSCNVLLLWSNNENVSVYSHYSSKVKQPKSPGAKRTTLCEFKMGKLYSQCLVKTAGRPIFSLQQLNQLRIFKKMPHKCSNTEGVRENENTSIY